MFNDVAEQFRKHSSTLTSKVYAGVAGLGAILAVATMINGEPPVRTAIALGVAACGLAASLLYRNRTSLFWSAPRRDRKGPTLGS